MARRQKKRTPVRTELSSKAVSRPKPFWRRWWFFTCLVALLAGSIAAVKREPIQPKATKSAPAFPTLQELVTMTPEQLENVESSGTTRLGQTAARLDMATCNDDARWPM